MYSNEKLKLSSSLQNKFTKFVFINFNGMAITIIKIRICSKNTHCYLDQCLSNTTVYIPKKMPKS